MQSSPAQHRHAQPIIAHCITANISALLLQHCPLLVLSPSSPIFLRSSSVVHCHSSPASCPLLLPPSGPPIMRLVSPNVPQPTSFAYCSPGLGVLFDKLQQGIQENQQVLAIARTRADAEELYSQRLSDITPVTNRIAGGFERDDG